METFGTSQLHYKDSSANMDSILDDTSNFNLGLVKRSSWTNVGKIVDLCGLIYADICQQNRLIIPNVPIQFKLYPSKDSFRLMTGTEQYKISLVDINLQLCQVQVSKDIMYEHLAALKAASALYPAEKTVIKPFR
jgi:hypothetical protein